MIYKKQDITYLRNKEINRQKWDTRIEESTDGTIYVLSFYLDRMSKHWDALVLDDYKVLMPLIWNKKYGFYYLYQPYFLQHIGIFGDGVTEEIVKIFLLSIPAHFKYWDVDFKENIINADRPDLPDLSLKKRRNFLLPLNESYERIKREYKRGARRMIQTAKDSNIKVTKNCDPGEVISFYENTYRRLQKYSRDDYQRLVAATTFAFKSGKTSTYLAKTQRGEVVAAFLLLKDKRFVYSVIGGSNAVGKQYGAFYLVIDAAIKDHAASGLIFRFEGSDKEGIAFFNAQFNSVPVAYYHVKVNRLPWPIKLLKK